MTTYILTIGGNTKRSKFAPMSVELDFDKLDARAQDHIIRYGLKQYLADGVAAAESQEAFNNGVNERIRKLKECDFTRTRGDKAPVDDTMTLALTKAKEAVRAKAKSAGVKLPKERVEQLAQDLLKGPKGQDYIDAAAEEIKRRAALVDDIDLGDIAEEAIGAE